MSTREELLITLGRLSQIESDWNGYQAFRPSETSVDLAKNILDLLSDVAISRLDVTLLSTGGIQIQENTGEAGKYFEIFIHDDGTMFTWKPLDGEDDHEIEMTATAEIVNYIETMVLV